MVIERVGEAGKSFHVHVGRLCLSPSFTEAKGQAPGPALWSWATLEALMKVTCFSLRPTDSAQPD